MPQYIDPGNTSLLWQLLLSGIFGLSFALRRYVLALLRWFARRIRKDAPKDPDAP
jgi:hypothetical protein